MSRNLTLLMVTCTLFGCKNNNNTGSTPLESNHNASSGVISLESTDPCNGLGSFVGATTIANREGDPKQLPFRLSVQGRTPLELYIPFGQSCEVFVVDRERPGSLTGESDEPTSRSIEEAFGELIPGACDKENGLWLVSRDHPKTMPAFPLRYASQKSPEGSFLLGVPLEMSGEKPIHCRLVPLFPRTDI